MKQYRCHKLIHAGQITNMVLADYDSVVESIEVDGIDELGGMPKGFSSRGIPTIGDYLIIDIDGHISWVTKARFENEYTLEGRKNDQ